jgi:hypothetical protein
MTFVEAYTYAKAFYTKSESSKDFSTKSQSLKKDLKDMTKEEVLSLKDNKKLLEWSRAN